MKPVLCLLLVLTLSAASLFASDKTTGPPVTPDTKLADLAKAIPGFGGFFYDRDRIPHVWVIGHEGYAAARDHFGPKTVFHAAQYEMTKLLDWRARARRVLALPGVASLDLDEARNRVVVGIERGSAASERAQIERDLALESIPRDAVLLEETDPIERIAQLTDSIRPQPGGVSIDYFPGGSGHEYCTLGFNVDFSLGNGFITCSHCTATDGQLDYDNVGWGVEERDPPYFTGGVCPAGRQCRWSDSALIYYAYQAEQGDSYHIAQPTNSAACSSGSITISTSNPRFNVVGTSSPSSGDPASKVGIATGWTSGDVTNPCFDANISGTNITLLCQFAVGLHADFYDSGSPVFAVDSGNNVILYGLLWGKSGSCTGLFSDLWSIDYEVGPFTVEVCTTC